MVRLPDFSVISGSEVAEVLEGEEGLGTRTVEKGYLSHDDGDTVNPDS
jgi:N-[(2S)-2-amino-2-carboxyethyl]-L-glutamate dehydrogenase